jgi:hypothetical protein
MTVAAFAPTARQRIFSATGVISSGALLYTYQAGSTTPLATYSDSALTIANANPVVADSTGLLGPVYLLPQAYKFVVTDSLAVTLWEQDDVWDTGELVQAQTETKFCTTQFNAVTSTTGTTLTNVVGLSGFTLATSGVYKFDISIAGTSTVNSGLKLGFGLTTATLTNNEAVGVGHTASAVATQHTTTATTGMTLFGQTAAVIHVRISGRLTVNVAGTLAVQAAQNAAHADTTSVYLGSWATFTQVS